MKAFKYIFLGVVASFFLVSAITGANTNTIDLDLPTPMVPEDYVPPGGVMPAPRYVLPPSITSYSEEDRKWMQTNIYFESRNQSFADMIAVGFVVMNRVADPRYPNTIKEVVTKSKTNKNGIPILNKCHFSWYCDGKSDQPNLAVPIERRAWERAGRAAHAVLSKDVADPTHGAVYYHALTTKPYWAQKDYATKTVKLGHVFYTRI